MGFGLGSLIGGIVGAGADIYNTSATNAANAREAQKNRDFQWKSMMQQQGYQTEMANTAHQRQIADMKKAGLNPMLSAGATGATTPAGGTGLGGAMATMQKPNVSSAFDGVQRYLQAKTAEANLKNIEADTLNKTSSNSLILNQAANTLANTDLTKTNTAREKFINNYQYNKNKPEYGHARLDVQNFTNSNGIIDQLIKKGVITNLKLNNNIATSTTNSANKMSKFADDWIKMRKWGN